MFKSTKKWVVFEIEAGSFSQGFPVKLRIRQPGRSDILKASGQLAPAPEIPQLYQDWQSRYWDLGGKRLIRIPQTQTTNVSGIDDCHQAAQALKQGLNEWLNQRSLRRLVRGLLQAIAPAELQGFMIQTSDAQLRRLPWHLWDLFEDHFSEAEVVLSSDLALNTPLDTQTILLQQTIHILAIEGNTLGTEATLTEAMIRQPFPLAQVKLLIQPSSSQLRSTLWEHTWDLLFFVGHSASHTHDCSGEIQLNPEETLSLDDLHYALQQSVHKGLKLAIFNSCDGLGLARKLADLQIPYVIVMREPVPDQVAQTFLQGFLASFARGSSVHHAVHAARLQLQDLSQRYLCAAWLPVICQNLVAPSLRYRQPMPSQLKWMGVAGVLITVAIATAVVFFLREQVWQSRLSWGERLLITAGATPEKRAGINAFARQDWKNAEKLFEQSLDQYPNDPETRIYLNNSRVNDGINDQSHPLPTPIKIVVSVPIGSNSNVAQEILRGLAHRQTEVNENGGIRNRHLQVLIADDRNDPGISQELAQRFVQDPALMAAIAHNASDASVAAAPIFNRGQMVMVTPTSFSDKLSSDGPYIFRMVPNMRFLSDQLALYLLQTDPQAKVVICNDSYAADNESFRNQFANSISDKGLTLLKIECDFSAPTFQANPALTQIQESGANTILLAPHVDRIQKALEIAAANQGKLRLLGSPTLYTDITLTGGKASVNRLATVVPWYTSTSPHQEFVKQAIRMWGGMVSWRTAMAYDATMVITEGLQKANTRLELSQVLRGKDFAIAGASGKVEFLPSGERNNVPHVATLVQIQPDPQNPSRYRFVPIAAKPTSP